MNNPSKQFEMIRLYPRLSDDPIVGKVGELYYNTTTDSLKLCTNDSPATWTTVGGTTFTQFQNNNAFATGGGLFTNSELLPSSNILTFDQTIYIQVPGLPNESNKIGADSFTLNNNEVVYVDLNKSSVPQFLTPIISSADLVDFNENRFILARCVNGIVTVDSRLFLPSGQSGSLDSNRTTIETQNNNFSLVGGGTWSSSASNSITIENNAYLYTAGLPAAANTILAGTCTVAPGNVLYVKVFRSGFSNFLTISELAINSYFDTDSFILAYNDGNGIILSNGEKLHVGESKVLGESVSIEVLSNLGIADWKDKEGQIRLIKDQSSSTRTTLTPANKIAIDGTIRSLSVKNLNAVFPGAVINWSDGNIYDYSVSSVISTFTSPVSEIGANGFRWFSVSLKPSTTSVDNEANFDIIITPAASNSSTLKANYASGAIPVGQILLQTSGGTLQPVLQTNIIQNSASGGGSGGSIADSAKLIGGGTWSLSGQTLTWNQYAYVEVKGLPILANRLNTGNFTLSDQQALYVNLFDSGSSNLLTPIVANISTVVDSNSFIIAYNKGGEFWLANGERLISGESKQAGESLSNELLNFIGASSWVDSKPQLKITADGGAPRAYIAPINKTGVDLTVYSSAYKNCNVIFNGATIDWNDSEVRDSLGNVVSEFSVNNDPGRSIWYSINLVPDVPGVPIYNEVTLIPQIIQSDDVHSKAQYLPGAIQLGQVRVTTNGSGHPTSIDQSNVIQNITNPSFMQASGNSNEVQFNNSGLLGSDSRFTWDSSTGTLNVNGLSYGGLVGPLTILDDKNTWTAAISFNKTTYKYAIIEYSLAKSGTYRVGRFLVTNDGTNIGFNDDYTETVFSGVNFDAQINGSNVEVIYTSSLTGANGALKYSIKAWA